MIAALQGDLDTSDGVGKVFFRQDSSPGVLRRAAEHMNRAFPEDDEVSPAHAVIVTWVHVAPHEPESGGDSLDRKVSIGGSHFFHFKLFGSVVYNLAQAQRRRVRYYYGS